MRTKILLELHGLCRSLLTGCGVRRAAFTVRGRARSSPARDRVDAASDSSRGGEHFRVRSRIPNVTGPHQCCARRGARRDSTQRESRRRAVARARIPPGGQLGNVDHATISVNQNATMSIGATTATASIVSVSYPFSFIVLNPVANLVRRGSTLGGAPLTMNASAEMRNEAQ